MAKIIVFANQKGGVGKTTTAVNLGAYLADVGKRVLLVDFDSQSNTTSSVGADKNLPGIYEVITGKADPISAIQACSVPGLSIIPSSINLTGATIELVDQAEREFFLKKAMDKIHDRFDYIFIDSPPSLGILTLNGLVAADFVIIPLQCEYFAMEGLGALTSTIDLVKQSYNPQLQIEGILLTMFDPRNNLSHQVAREVRDYFGSRVFRTVIPRNVRLGEAPSFGRPVVLYDAACPGALAYLALAKELMNKHR